MKPLRFETARGFLLRFVLAFGLLMLPWPGLQEGYGAVFRWQARTAFARDTGPRELTFAALPPAHGLDLSRIEIVNRLRMAPDGSGPVRDLDLDTSGFWRTTALLLALLMATPLAWPRRTRALLWGGLGIQGFILLGAGFALWNESRYVGLVTLSPFWASAADKLQYLFISQLSLAAPVLIWILVTFRPADFRRLVSAATGRAPSPAPRLPLPSARAKNIL